MVAKTERVNGGMFEVVAHGRVMGRLHRRGRRWQFIPANGGRSRWFKSRHDAITKLRRRRL